MRGGAFEIPILHLPEGESEFALPASAEAAAIAGIAGSIGASGTIRKVGDRLLLSCTVSVSYRRPCDRCLDEFDGAYTAAYEQWYVAAHYSRISVPVEEEAYVIPPETRFITIDEDVREYALMGAPVKYLCREDCKGLCPRCGRNLNREQCMCRTDDAQLSATAADLLRHSEQ